MKVRAIRWWSRDALDEAVAIFESRWSQWCTDWAVPQGSVSAANAFECEAFDEAPPAWLPLGGAGMSMWWAMPSASAALGIRELLYGSALDRSTPRLPAPSLADDVAAAAWVDLQRSFATAFEASGPRDAGGLWNRAGDRPEDGPVPPSTKPWSGDLRMRLKSPRQAAWHIDLFIAAGQVEQRLRSHSRVAVTTAADAKPIEPVTAALRDRPLRLRVALKSVALDLATLQSLRVGDVVALPHCLDDALHVHTAPGALAGGTRHIGFAHLGARAGQRAIELTREPTEA